MREEKRPRAIAPSASMKYRLHTLLQASQRLFLVDAMISLPLIIK